MTAMRKLWARRAATLGTAICIAGITLGAQPADMQAQPAGESSEQRGPEKERPAAEFKAVEGAQKESVPGGVLLVTAYGLAWLLLLLFIVRLGKLHASAVRDVERIERSLASTDTDTDGNSFASGHERERSGGTG